MTDIAATARDKLAYHRKQVSELEAFLRVYDALSQSASETLSVGDTLSADIVRGNTTLLKTVDKSPARRRRGRSKMRPDDVSDLRARVIREVGRPLTRGEIVTAFDRRDVEIPYEDKGRYIGTIAWRNKGRFVNIEGRGYWLRDEPLPAAVPPPPQLDLES